MISEQSLLQAQDAWARGVEAIGRCSETQRQSEARSMLERLYDFSHPLMFKPTKAAQAPFRGSFEAALSYFIGGNPAFPEDAGFALQPWVRVRFENASLSFDENFAFAQGHYYFTPPEGTELKVEYSFGYRAVENEGLKIFLHHSSLPFSV
ncbi:MAG: hypothetical protein MI717_00385 [Spirochaetales bacterium]|nr:hypothetical protein [Spirochaetales bacterium]